MQGNRLFNSKKFLAIQALALLHVIEELAFGFPEWATQHFGTTSRSWYVLSHILLAFPLLWVALHLYRGNRVGILGSWIVQTVVVTNGLFHVITTFMFREYSPGVISQILLIPISYYVFRALYRSRAVRGNDLLFASVIGCVISLAFIVSLLTDVPI